MLTPRQVRLGDTDLLIEVEKDHTVYGDECKFGGGKVLREGMGQVRPFAEWRATRGCEGSDMEVEGQSAQSSGLDE